MKNFLFALLLALVGCGDHGNDDILPAQKTTTVSRGVPVSDIQNEPGVLSQIELEHNKYILFRVNEVGMYADVVFPQILVSKNVEKAQPGRYRGQALGLLTEYSTALWLYEKTERKPGWVTFTFREATKEEVGAARKTIKEMRGPLVPQ